MQANRTIHPDNVDKKIRAERLLDTSPFGRLPPFQDAPSSPGIYRNNRRADSASHAFNLERLLDNLDLLGVIHAETRNRDAVFRFTGRYGEFLTAPDENPHFCGRNVRQLHFFPDNSHPGITIRVNNQTRITDGSLHFFDGHGMLIHTIRQSAQSNREAFESILNTLVHAANPEPIRKHRSGAAKYPHLHRPIDPKEFRGHWLALRDEPERLGLLNEYRISELQALRLIGDTWANPVPMPAVQERLALLVQIGLPCTLELSNTGAQQVYSGKIENMRLESGQLILDGPRWRLQVRLSEIDSAWLVAKPTERRPDHSIMFYNHSGQAIARMTGTTADSLDQAVWQDLIGSLPTME